MLTLHWCFMRLFTAIDIPEEIKQRLDELIGRLRPSAKLAWSTAKNLHVTTKFIGDWPEGRLAEIQRTLSDVAVPAPFQIALRGLGWFPNARNPRVLWAGVEGPPELERLARDTAQAVAGIGVPQEDRAFHPHLTLARRRDPVPVEELKRSLAGLPSEDFGSFRAGSFFLYLSAGGRYTQLQEFPFE